MVNPVHVKVFLLGTVFNIKDTYLVEHKQSKQLIRRTQTLLMVTLRMLHPLGQYSSHVANAESCSYMIRADSSD